MGYDNRRPTIGLKSAACNPRDSVDAASCIWISLDVKEKCKRKGHHEVKTYLTRITEKAMAPHSSTLAWKTKETFCCQIMVELFSSFQSLSRVWLFATPRHVSIDWNCNWWGFDIIGNIFVCLFACFIAARIWEEVGSWKQKPVTWKEKRMHTTPLGNSGVWQGKEGVWWKGLMWEHDNVTEVAVCVIPRSK